MKKLATTFGLLALMLVVTSFTTPVDTGGSGTKKPVLELNNETGGSGTKKPVLEFDNETGGSGTKKPVLE